MCCEGGLAMYHYLCPVPDRSVLYKSIFSFVKQRSSALAVEAVCELLRLERQMCKQYEKCTRVER
jgi:hypothetical protein